MIQGSVGIVAVEEYFMRSTLIDGVADLPGEALYDVPLGSMVSIAFQIYR